MTAKDWAMNFWTFNRILTKFYAEVLVAVGDRLLFRVPSLIFIHFKGEVMVHYKRAYLLFAAVLAFSAGNLWADNATPVSTPATPSATKSKSAKADSPTVTAMKAAIALADAGKTDEAIAAFEKMGVLKSKNMEAW